MNRLENGRSMMVGGGRKELSPTHGESYTPSPHLCLHSPTHTFQMDDHIATQGGFVLSIISFALSLLHSIGSWNITIYCRRWLAVKYPYNSPFSFPFPH